jgi:hypothetical protein
MGAAQLGPAQRRVVQRQLAGRPQLTLSLAGLFHSAGRPREPMLFG